MTAAKLHVPSDRLADFCRRWKIVELSLFGSVLRDDFGPDSDVDVLVTYEPGVHHGIEAFETMRSDLESMLGRAVDLVERPRLTNPFLRRSILASRQTIYAA